MIRERSKVIEWLKASNGRFWILKNLGKTMTYGEMPDDSEDQTIEGSISRFEHLLDIHGAGQYNVQAWSTKGNKNARLSANFEITEAQPIHANMQGISGLSRDDLQTEVEKAMFVYDLKKENEELKKQLAQAIQRAVEAERESNSTLTRVGAKLEPYLGSIMEGMGFAPKSSAAVAGLPASDSPEQNRLEAAFELWQKNETDPITIVEKIAHMAEHDKGTYSIARGMLIK